MTNTTYQELLSSVTKWVSRTLTPCDEDKRKEIVRVGDREMEYYKDDLIDCIITAVTIRGGEERMEICDFYVEMLKALNYNVVDDNNEYYKWVADDINYLHNELQEDSKL